MIRGAAAALLLLVVAPISGMGAQSSSWRDEVGVGSERELYERVLGLAARGAAPVWEPWARDSGSASRFRVIRPRVAVSANQGFPWRVLPDAHWEGRGVTAMAAAGVVVAYGPLSARLEPFAQFTSNAAFPLDTPTIGFRDAMRPLSIDLPQRFGADAMGRIDPGESFVRAEWFGARIDFSHARRFWGPGVRHALLLSAQSPRFPHIAIGTAGPLRTILGTFDAELLYARLDQSDWSPPSAATRRFGTGFRAAWTPPRVPLQVGTARFYHRAWPESFTARDLLAPFGSLFYDEQLRAGGPEDNQLASIFFHLSARRAMLELFGEFGRNDRSVDLRDFIVEPEHNSAWLLGVMKVFSLDSAARRFWSVRYEAANGRIPPLQDLQRGQTTFFEHAPLNQGHTHRGALLGSPLLDRSGGSELAVDRWDSGGRIGASIFQRQMPPDILVGMPRDRTRSQWDVRVSALRFFGLSELSGQIGYVWDLNRFANKDVGNVYVAAGWRRSIR